MKRERVDREAGNAIGLCKKEADTKTEGKRQTEAS
jgi:hypothetical protein